LRKRRFRPQKQHNHDDRKDETADGSQAEHDTVRKNTLVEGAAR
jgi:hypothetical protein